MANVVVDIEKLKNVGKTVQSIYDSAETNYNNVKSIDINVSSFDSFQTALANKMADFKSHSGIFNNRITECADTLESIDSNIIASLDTDSSTDDIETVSTSNYLLSDSLDYTFDSSNVGISVDELYAKAEVIKNSDLPINIKVVKAAKLLHEYTYGWTWDRNRLSYSSFRSTLEIPSKTMVCATGVSDALYLAGAVNTIGNQAGIFNPNYQTNILVTVQKNGWQRIDSTDFDELQPGDIIFTGYNGIEYTHVEIYAGNGYAYTWGNTSDMGKESPKSVSASGYQNSSSCAYRITTTSNV